MENLVLKHCKEIAKNIRKDIVELTWLKKSGHLGGSASCVEIIAALCGVLNIDPKNPESENRDRFILSKGQATMTFYSAYKQMGFFTQEELLTFKDDDSVLSLDLVINEARGIENSNGSLGQCLSFAMGTALGLKMRNKTEARVFTLIGDGECNEGAIWEAALFGAQHNLNNLIVIIDKNGLQYDGDTTEILSMEPMDKKWESFGWNAINVNGHNIEQLFTVLNQKYNKPTVIIAKTIKGKGISFAQNNPDWHAQWVSLPNAHLLIQECELRAVPYFRREFTLPDKSGSARILICGVGFYELYLNGEKVGNHVLDPAVTNYTRRLRYVVYDVTNLLHPGENVVGVVLGNGWYNSPQFIFQNYPRMMLQLELDGKPYLWTDSSWKVTSSGPLVSGGVRNGETYDARLELDGWLSPEYDDCGWLNCGIVAGPGGKLEEQTMPPCKVMQILPVKKSWILKGTGDTIL